MTQKTENVAALAAELRAFDKLEPVIHEKVRLALVSVLAVNRSLTFTELRNGLRLTDGNLAAHLRALGDAGFIRLRKVGTTGKPVTAISLTRTGRNAFAKYLEGLEHIVKRHR
jgi:DNA-binding transcriptional ArsR family regulator